MSLPGKELGTVASSRFWLQVEEPLGFGLEGIRLGQLLEGGPVWIRRDPDRIAAARTQVGQ